MHVQIHGHGYGKIVPDANRKCEENEPPCNEPQDICLATIGKSTGKNLLVKRYFSELLVMFKLNLF